MRLTLFAMLGLVGSCSVLAAPAPKDKPWVTGWDKPIDPAKKSKFVRVEGVLTISAPGMKADPETLAGFAKAPRLLREVSGDFIVEVRVGGDFTLSDERKREGSDSTLAAGLVLMDGKKVPAGTVGQRRRSRVTV